MSIIAESCLRRVHNRFRLSTDRLDDDLDPATAAGPTDQASSMAMLKSSSDVFGRSSQPAPGRQEKVLSSSSACRILVAYAEPSCNLPNGGFLHWLLIPKGLRKHDSRIEKSRCSFGTDCEYVTKCLCEKSLNKRRCISYPWRS